VRSYASVPIWTSLCRMAPASCNCSADFLFTAWLAAFCGQFGAGYRD
jgi:hypothetical protein